MRRALSLCLQALLAGACVWYLLRNLDMGRLWANLTAVPLWAAAAGLAVLLAELCVLALRTRSLCPQATFWHAFRAENLGLGLNNLLPAKLGELAKAAYLGRRAPGGFCGGLDVVFWGRLFDVNALLLLSLAAGALYAPVQFSAPLAIFLCAAWATLFLLRARPAVAKALVGRLPQTGPLGLARQIVLTVPQRLSLGLVAGLGWRTCLLWGLTVLMHAVVLGAVLTPAPGLAVAVFATAAGMLGMAAPSLPGAVGVYEAALVLALGATGHSKEQALAAAVVLHALMVAPPTLIGLWVFWGEGLSLGSLLRGSREAQPCATTRED